MSKVNYKKTSTDMKNHKNIWGNKATADLDTIKKKKNS